MERNILDLTSWGEVVYSDVGYFFPSQFDCEVSSVCTGPVQTQVEPSSGVKYAPMIQYLLICPRCQWSRVPGTPIAKDLTRAHCDGIDRDIWLFL